MPPNRTLLICSPSIALRGGVESIINGLCRELPHHGWEVILALGKGSRFNNPGVYSSMYPDLPVIEVNGTKGTRLGRIEALIEIFKKTSPAVVLSARVFDAYEAVSVMKQEVRAPRLAVAIRAYEPHYLSDAAIYQDLIDLCVADGKLLRAAAIKCAGLRSDRVVSIPGGVRIPEMPPTPRVVRNILQIGYVGRLTQSDKRILDIIPFLRRLENHSLQYHFRIVGEGPEEQLLRENLSSLISDGKVSFCGWKEQRELYEEIYPSLDCILNFSPAEGVTISGREAMANGVVPVTSKFVGLKAEGLYLNESNALTFPVGDLEAAAVAIVRLVTETGLMTHLSSNAAHSQSNEYTHEGSIRAWASALDCCLERPPAIGPVPKLNLPADGRLTRFGLSPRMSQRVRKLLGRTFEHSDPGSEWPTGSGLITEAENADIMRYAFEHENSHV